MDISGIITLIVFMLIIALCCNSVDDTSSNNSTTKRYTSNQNRRTDSYSSGYSYSECPSCGALGYDGYCEECGYPDINQGWIGEEYG